MNVVLASASPRREELLKLLISHFVISPAHVDETALGGEVPEQYVLRLAREKASAVELDGRLVIAADTTVTVDGLILGKPEDRTDARAMLKRLDGRDHWVHTAVAVRWQQQLLSRLVSTRVQFAALYDDLIEAYLDTDEPWDKAGGYGIQGFAGSFVERIEGSYSAVVGLPLRETRELLREFHMMPEWSAN